MTYLTLKELYDLFLGSDWWINLSRTKRRQVGKCERCNSRNRLQSHHRFYRDNWFDTRLEDLECLCRACHEKEHGFTKAVPVVAAVMDGEIATWKQLRQARSQKRISREEYLRLVPSLKPKKHPKKAYRKANNPPKKRPVNGCRPWFYSPRRKHWVNRGSSSN